MTMCACGKPLHYTDPRNEKIVSEAVAKCGPDLIVVGPFGRYLVQRHYLALHGLKGSELVSLAKRGIIRNADGHKQGQDVFLAKDGITKGA